MYQIYSINTLKVKSLADLKAIASQVGAVAADRRSKQSWIDAILDKQPQPVEPAKTEFDVVGDEVIADGEAIAKIAQDDNLTQPWVVQINGVEIFRANTWAQCFSHICWHYKQGTLPIPSEPADDYLHHDDQPIKLPQVGESHFIGNYFLRCVAIGGEYAAVWDVSCDGSVMGEIRMSWNTLWTHTLSFEAFAIPQEAIVNLHESLQAYKQEQQMQVVVTYSVQVCHLEAHVKGFVASWEEDALLDVKFIRAFKYLNCGDARTHYEVSRDGEEWLKLLKQKQSAKVKRLLPTMTHFPSKKHLAWRGLREEAKFYSEIISV